MVKYLGGIIMKKILAALLLGMSINAMAGVVEVNGKKTMTTIKASERDNHIKFSSVVPNLTMRVSKVTLLKAMTRIGKTNAIIEIERNGLLVDTDRKVAAVLDRVGDGLWIRTATTMMFITEKELDKVRK